MTLSSMPKVSTKQRRVALLVISALAALGLFGSKFRSVEDLTAFFCSASESLPGVE